MSTSWDEIDRRILEIIDDTRAEFHACTMRRVAAVMGMAEATCRGRVDKLRKMGLVEWNDIPGSLRRVELPAEVESASAGLDPEDVDE